MIIRPLSSAGFILSYKCSSRCRHCLYCCSNQWDGWMDTALMEAIFDGTRECGVRFRGLHLAGGEAFINFPVLLEAVRTATRMRIPIDYVETNGHWFTTREEAIEKLTALKEAGLDCIMVSASPQHLEYIPFWKTLGAIEACQAVFGQGGMFVWLTDFLREIMDLGVTDTMSYEEYAKAVGPTRARQAATYGGQLVPGGRSAFKQAGYLPTRPAEDWFGGTCRHELLESSHGHYDLYGNLLPSSCAGLTLGDAHDLPKMCREFTLDDKPAMRSLVEQGVKGLFRMAVAEYGYVPLEGYSGKCHLCMDIRRHLVTRGHAKNFPEISPTQLYSEI